MVNLLCAVRFGFMNQHVNSEVKLHWEHNKGSPHIVLTISKVASKLNTVAAIVEEMNGQWSLLKIVLFNWAKEVTEY